MPYILQQGCTIMCPHGGQAQVVTTNTRVKAGGGFALLPTDTYIISGCIFTLPNGKPQPCVGIQWQAPAVRVKVNGTGVLLESSVGLCKSAEQIIQGPASISGVQRQVQAQ